MISKYDSRHHAYFYFYQPELCDVLRCSAAVNQSLRCRIFDDVEFEIRALRGTPTGRKSLIDWCIWVRPTAVLQPASLDGWGFRDARYENLNTIDVPLAPCITAVAFYTETPWLALGQRDDLRWKRYIASPSINDRSPLSHITSSTLTIKTYWYGTKCILWTERFGSEFVGTSFTSHTGARLLPYPRHIMHVPYQKNRIFAIIRFWALTLLAGL